MMEGIQPVCIGEMDVEGIQPLCIPILHKRNWIDNKYIQQFYMLINFIGQFVSLLN